MSAVTDEMLNIATIVWGVTSALSAVSCLVILLASAYIYTIPEARPCLDRISFRLMLWAAGMEFINSVFWLLTSVSPSFANYIFEYNFGACAALIYVIIATTGAINWLNACIGLNLVLAIRSSLKHHHRQLEWWYIGGSLFLGFFVPLVPAILGHFGPDPIYQDCWFTEANPRRRVGNMLLDFYIWQALSCVIGGGAVALVIYTTVLHGRSTTRALLVDNVANSMASSDIKLNHLKDKLMDIALRVAAYPIVLVVTMLISMAADFYFTFQPIDTIGAYVFDVVGTLVLCGRGIVFGLLMFFVDPSLRRAFQNIRLLKHTPLSEEFPEDPAGQSFAEFLSTSAIDTRCPSTSSIAPRHLEPSSAGLQEKASSVFFGVQTASLPRNFTEDIDVEMPKIVIYEEQPRSAAEDAARRMQEIEALL